MSSTPTPTKVSISPSFKGQFTSIMRQRQLFLDAQQRASQSTHPQSTHPQSTHPNSNTSSSMHRIWRSISNWVSFKKEPPSKAADDAKAGSSIFRKVLPVFIIGISVGVGWGLAQQHSSSLVATRWPSDIDSWAGPLLLPAAPHLVDNN